MRFKICSLFVLLLALSPIANAIDRQEVKLEKKILSSTGKLEGISNIFFHSLNDSRFQYPQDWKDIEIAPILDNKAFVPIHALRYRNISGQIQYIVDTNGDLDFRNETALQFQQNKTLQIADSVFTVQPIDKKENSQKVSYQVIKSSDGYTYARISEYRQGEIRFGNNSYSVFLRPRVRNTPLYNLSSVTICLIDRDRDGSFSSAWRLSTDGKISQTEELDLAFPFILDGRKLRVVQLAADGTHLTVESTNEETAISPGFKAPDFTLADIDKKVFKLKQLRGKIVFLEFWSVSCPFCKQILPQVNTLIKSKAGKDFVALAIVREEKREEVEAYLKQHPRNANVVLNEKSTWQIYDNQGITPTFYLIDQEGVVRFSGYGASPEQMRIIDRLIEGLRSK
jgi:thiol-disulfide isomerase/thioredoxin